MMNQYGHGLCSDRTSDVCVPMDTTFSEMHLINEKIRKGLKQANFIIPSPVQRKALPRTLCGFDTIFKSKSGTGKTAVFAITALQSIIDLKSNQAQVLILAPTREIAVQIVDVISTIGAHVKDLKADWFIGGTAIESDVEKLKNCRIVVGAPGRIAHLIELGHLNLKSVRLFVVDEADEMIQPIFRKDFNLIFNSLPANKQVLICSATFTFEIIKFLRKYMSTFCFISGDDEDNAEEEKLSFASLVGMKPFVSVIEAKYSYNKVVLFSKKLSRLQEILKTTTFSQCLIFSNYKTRVKTIVNMLSGAEFVATFLCSEQTQSERLQALEDLKHGKCRILVTTDLASRGIDVQNVDTVINFEVPINERTYLHRMGRAGRYGANGVVITIVAEGDEMASLRTTLTTIGASVFVLPSHPPLNAADVLKGKHPALEEISGSKVDVNHSSLSSTENISADRYVLGKEFLAREFGCEIGDINLKHFKDEIEQKMEKFKVQKKGLQNFDMTWYFSLCRLVKNFHPELLSYVEKIVFNAVENKSLPQTGEIKSILIDGDHKENMCPKSTKCGGSTLNNFETKTSRKSKAKTQPSLLIKNAESANCFQKDLAASFTLSRSFLKKCYSADWAEDISLEKFKPSVTLHCASLCCASSSFGSNLESLLKNFNKQSLDICSLSHASSSNGCVTSKGLEYYFCLCKRFKSMDECNLVEFVEKKLEEQRAAFLKKLDAVISHHNNSSEVENEDTRPLSYASSLTKTASPLAPNLIKRKPDLNRTMSLQSSDALKPRLGGSKYLYLNQNLLKRLYDASKINKDFCVEHARPSIEPSFTQLWKSNILTTTVINSLYRKDILKRPTKLLTNKNLEMYYQFCRHFKYLNPQLVSAVESKIRKIEGGVTSFGLDNRVSDEDSSNSRSSSKNTGRIPAEIIAFYYPEVSTMLKDLEVDEIVKEKVKKRFGEATNVMLDSKTKSQIGESLLIDASFSGNFFQFYFRLCKTFPNFDADFINHVESKVKESLNFRAPEDNSQIHSDSSNAPKKSTIGSCANALNCSIQDKTISSGTSCKRPLVANEEQIKSPIESSEVSVEAESNVQLSAVDGFDSCDVSASMSYKELSAYPPCQLSKKPSCETSNELLTELSNYLSRVLKTTETGSVSFCSDNKDLVPAVLHLLENKKDISDADIERFVKREANVNSSVKVKESKPTSNINEAVEQIQSPNLPHTGDNNIHGTSNLTYKNLLRSTQKFVGSNSHPAQTLGLDDKVKNEMESFLSRVSSQVNEQVSIGNLSAMDAFKLSCNDDETILPAMIRNTPASTAGVDCSITPPNELFLSNSKNERTNIGIANLSPEKMRVILDNLPDCAKPNNQSNVPKKLLLDDKGTNKKAASPESINIGIANLSPEKLRVVLESLPSHSNSNQTEEYKSHDESVTRNKKSDQKGEKSKTKADKVQASLVKDVNKWLHSSEISKAGTSKTEDDAPEWLTVFSSTDESDEEEQSPSKATPKDPKGSYKMNTSNFVSSDTEDETSTSMNLCDRCKSWYQSSKKANSKISGKNSLKTKRSKKSERRSKKNSCADLSYSRSDSQNQVPSYEDLILWYNTWYQQVVFSQQFVWYNEYMKGMMSHK